MSQKQLNTEALPQTCPACNKFYTEPVVLPCLHTVCRDCVSGGDKFKCPVCDEPYVENGLHGTGYPQDLLITNITAINDAIRVYKENDERMMCKSCCLVPTSSATNFCINCGVFICNFDTTAHVRFGSGKHNFVSLSQLFSPLSQLIPTHPYIKCPNHPSIHVDHICTQCDQLMCEDCSKLYHKDHPLHPCERFIEEQCILIGDKAKNLESKFTRRYEEEFHEQTSKLELQKDQMLSDVDSDFDAVISMIENRRNILKYSIISQHDERIKLLEAVYENNQGLNDKTKECLDKIKEYTVTYPTKYILPLAMTLMHRLDELEFHDPNLDFDITKVEYKPKGLLNLLNRIETIGEIDAIRTPKFQDPIVTFPKEMLKSEWMDSENDSLDLTLVTTTVTTHDYLIAVFKTDKPEVLSVSSPPFSPAELNATNFDPSFRITIFDPYYPAINQSRPKPLDVKSVSHIYTNNYGQTYLVDRVGKQLVKLDDSLDIAQTVRHSEQRHLLEDPVCISFDKANMRLLVYNQLTSNINLFDKSLEFVNTIEISVNTVSRFSRSNSEIQRQPISPRPRSKTSANVFFPQRMHSPLLNETTNLGINLAVNSKETMFFVPNTKQSLFVLDKEGNLMKEISLKEPSNQESSSNLNLQKQNSLERKSLSANSSSYRSRRRSNSNPKKSDHIQPPREVKPNFTTFVCVNANDTLFIHQDNVVYIFNSDLEVMSKEEVPESYNPKAMSVDFFGHIFYTTNESLLLC